MPTVTATEWKKGHIPNDGYYFVRGLLATSLGGDSRPVFIHVTEFTFGFNEADDPESIELDSGITRDTIEWRSVVNQAEQL